jgi:hypothetical protein
MKLRLLLGLGLALAAMSCDNGPAAGDLSVEFTTPNSDDGALQFVATGTNGQTISSLSQACSGCKLFQVKVSDTQYKGVVTGSLGSGTLFRVSVSDAKHPSNYSVVIVGVAAKNPPYGMRTSLTGYSIALK